MSEASKATNAYLDAHVRPNTEDPIRLAEAAYDFSAGARALLEWARSKQIYGFNFDGKQTPLGTVNLSDLEAYFEEKKI